MCVLYFKFILLVLNVFAYDQIANKSLKIDTYSYEQQFKNSSINNQINNSSEQITANSTCPLQLDNKYVSFQEGVIIFSKFKNFTEIIPECKYDAVEEILIEPYNEMLIDKSFQIGNLFKENQLSRIHDVNLGNIRGIDVEATFSNTKISKNILVGFSFSKLDIYSNQTILTASQCNTQIYNNLNSFFKYFTVIVFSQVSYPKNEFCPLIFLNSTCKQFIFEDITNSFLTRNTLKFTKLNLSENFDLGTRNLNMINLCLYYEVLSEDIMNKHLFMSVRELKISRVLAGVERGLFRKFNYLKNIDFRIDNFKQFFHQDNSWLNDLNLNG